MKRIIFAAIAVFIGLNAWSQRVRHCSTQCSGALDAVVDSIDFRTDLTRVYARLKGTPHTASRINSILMSIGAQQLTMTDLDGVDPERWFQWEDSPYLPVEIDFPAVKKHNDKIVFIITGPRGKSTWIVK